MEFAEYLLELADASTRLKVAELARLSGLNPEQEAAFSAAWPDIDVTRRREVVQELQELLDDNVEFDFDAVFMRGLDDEDAKVRLASVRGSWEHEGPDFIARLVQMMQRDEDAGVRAESALGLGRFVLRFEDGRLRERHFREAEAGLRELLSNAAEIDEVRARALEAIGAHDDTWVRQAISEAYESGMRRMKVAAVHAMGRSCEPRWLPLLFRELANEEPEVRYEAATALGSLGAEGAVPHLVRSLSDSDQEVRDAAITALGEIGGLDARNALAELVREGSPAVKEAALSALAEIDFEEDPLSYKYRT